MRRFSRGGNARVKRASVAGLALAVAWLGCSLLTFSAARAEGQPVPIRVEPSPAPANPAQASPTQTNRSRWLYVPPAEPEVVEPGPAGSLRIIEDGMRIELRADGSMVQGGELLPPGAHYLEVPAWLGGGFVFWSHVERATWLWRSDRFTSPLRPLAQVSTIVQRVVPGFDRLLLWSGASQALRGLNASTGQLLDPGGLPASSAYGGMAFASSWFGVVASDIYGTQVTVDSGTTWHRLGIDDLDLQLQLAGTSIELRSNHDRYLLDPRGMLTTLTTRQEHSEESEIADGGEDDEGLADVPPHVNRLGINALVAALQQGFQLDADSAVVVRNGALTKVRLSDAGIVQQNTLRFAHPARCQALRLGRGHGFVCADTTSTTHVYRYEPGFKLGAVARFSTKRDVWVSGTGGLLIAGACANDAPTVARDRYCSYNGKAWRELNHQTKARDLLAVTAQGRFVALTPPDLQSLGSVLQVRDGKSERHSLKVAALSERLRNLLALGRWLSPLTEGPGGEFSTWVVGDQQFVGVKVQRDGTLQIGPLRSDLASTRFQGSIAMTVTAGGVGYESHNFGFDWHTVNLPTSVSLPDPYDKPARRGAMNDWGCTELGCVFGSWLRIGAGSGAPTQASEPPRATFAKQGLPHWSMQCRPTGERRDAKQIASVPTVETETSRRSPRATAPTAFDAIEDGPWRPFLDSAPPNKNAQPLALDIGNDEYRTQFRAYAWGPRNTDWTSLARWQMKVANRFAVDSVWSTNVARAPWPTPIAAAQAFGQGDKSSEFVDWSVALDARGDAGLVRLLTRAGGELFWAEKGRPIQPLQHGSQLDLQKPMSLARLQGRRYIAGERDGTFLVFQLEADQLEPLGRYPVLAPDSMKTQLVTSRASDALAIWIKTPDRGWFIFPLSLETGDPLPALHVPLGQLNDVPRTCTAEDQGWQMVSDVPLATLAGSSVNVRLSFPADLDDVKVRDVEARMLVTQSGLCLEALAGRLDEGSFATKQSPLQASAGGSPVAATLTDRATGRRFGLRCGR